MEFIRKLFRRTASSSETPPINYQPPPEALDALREEEAHRRHATTRSQGSYPYARGPLYGIPNNDQEPHQEIAPAKQELDSHELRDLELAAAGDEFEGNTIEIIGGEASAGTEPDDRPNPDENDN